MHNLIQCFPITKNICLSSDHVHIVRRQKKINKIVKLSGFHRFCILAWYVFKSMESGTQKTFNSKIYHLFDCFISANIFIVLFSNGACMP